MIHWLPMRSSRSIRWDKTVSPKNEAVVGRTSSLAFFYSKFSRFFDFFLSIFSELTQKILFVEIWPKKLQDIGLTWANFMFSVSLAFVWAYFRKNQSTFFFGNFFTWPWKIHNLSLGSKLKKRLLRSFYLFRATVCKNLSEFWNLT